MGREIFGEAWDGSGYPRRGPGRVRGPLGRSGINWETLGEFWDGWGTLGEVRDG